MQVTVNIEKRHAFMILGAILLLAVAIGVNAYVNPATGVGHDLEDINLTGLDDLTVNGLLDAKGSVNIDGTGGKFLYLNSGADIIKYGAEGEERYCKENGDDCPTHLPVNGSIMGMASYYSTGDSGACSSWGVGYCSSTYGRCRAYTAYEIRMTFGKLTICVKE